MYDGQPAAWSIFPLSGRPYLLSNGHGRGRVAVELQCSTVTGWDAVKKIFPFQTFPKQD